MISTDLQTTNSRHHGRSVRAFTLPELVVSVAVSGLIVASLGSALSIAARSIRPDATAAASLDAARCVQIIQNDLQFATRILDQSPRSIKVLTTDADRNGSPDVVNYTWSGTAGTALTRSVNGSTAVSICDGVTQRVPPGKGPVLLMFR